MERNSVRTNLQLEKCQVWSGRDVLKKFSGLVRLSHAKIMLGHVRSKWISGDSDTPRANQVFHTSYGTTSCLVSRLLAFAWNLKPYKRAVFMVSSGKNSSTNCKLSLRRDLTKNGQREQRNIAITSNRCQIITQCLYLKPKTLSCISHLASSRLFPTKSNIIIVNARICRAALMANKFALAS